jgi:hypothetical protein
LSTATCERCHRKLTPWDATLPVGFDGSTLAPIGTCTRPTVRRQRELARARKALSPAAGPFGDVPGVCLYCNVVAAVALPR